MSEQGDLALLDDPVARELLESTHLARLAYVWPDGTPRVVPIWFHWDGHDIVVGGPPDAPKMKALRANPKVAVTIDTETWPYHVLLIRGSARIETVESPSPEYAAAARRYMGDEAGAGWVENVKRLSPDMGRVAIEPEWVAILDFETRWPSAIARRMAAAGVGGAG